MEHPPFEDLMKEALHEATNAYSLGEVPVGAIVWHRGEVIVRAHNEVETQKNATAHAELLAIQRASAIIQNWRLLETILVVTLEPCPMCMGAVRQSRVPTVVFGARDPERGAAGSRVDLSVDSKLGPVPEIVSGVLESECSDILRKFFQECRKA